MEPMRARARTYTHHITSCGTGPPRGQQLPAPFQDRLLFFFIATKLFLCTPKVNLADAYSCLAPLNELEEGILRIVVVYSEVK